MKKCKNYTKNKKVVRALGHSKKLKYVEIRAIEQIEFCPNNFPKYICII